jgi:hypothetical protein
MSWMVSTLKPSRHTQPARTKPMCLLLQPKLCVSFLFTVMFILMYSLQVSWARNHHSLYSALMNPRTITFMFVHLALARTFPAAC